MVKVKRGSKIAKSKIKTCENPPEVGGSNDFYRVTRFRRSPNTQMEDELWRSRWRMLHTRFPSQGESTVVPSAQSS